MLKVSPGDIIVGNYTLTSQGSWTFGVSIGEVSSFNTVKDVPILNSIQIFAELLTFSSNDSPCQSLPPNGGITFQNISAVDNGLPVDLGWKWTATPYCSLSYSPVDPNSVQFSWKLLTTGTTEFGSVDPSTSTTTTGSVVSTGEPNLAGTTGSKGPIRIASTSQIFIAGVIVGSVLLLLAIGVGVFLILRRNRRMKTKLGDVRLKPTQLEETQ